ncbi:MAG: S9 family peptidase, partial [Proteobacteria bacterium]|nr:S9 family peptidase [Pseudomonadota bacterium]
MVRFIALFSLLMLTACSENTPTQSTTEPAAAEERAPVALIDRGALFGNPTRFQGRISPDGKWLSWLAPLDGVMNIWVAPADRPDDARAITADTGRGIPVHYWAYSNKHVLYTQDQGGNENLHVYAVDISTGEVNDLTPVMEGARATIESLSPVKPDSVLVGLNERDPQLFDLYEVSISTGEMTLLQQNPGFIGWMADNDLQPRLALKPLAGGGLQVVRLDKEQSVLMDIAAEDALNSSMFGFNRDNTILYAASSA